MPTPSVAKSNKSAKSSKPETCKPGFVAKTFKMNDFQQLQNTYASKFVDKSSNSLTLCVKPCDNGLIPIAPYTNIDPKNKPLNPLDYENESLGYMCTDNPVSEYNSEKILKVFSDGADYPSSVKCNKGVLYSNTKNRALTDLSCMYDATVYIASDKNQK